MYEPENGRIFVDNYDISKVDLQSIRSQIGIVPQDSLLFEGTIAENIALNDPEASSDSIIEAAKLLALMTSLWNWAKVMQHPYLREGRIFQVVNVKELLLPEQF